MNRFCTLLGLLAMIVLVSCNQFAELEEAQGAEYSADFALPLINTEFGMSDILENFQDDASLSVDSDGLLHFRYSGSVLTKTAEDIFEQINEDIPPTLGIPITRRRQGLPFSLEGNVTFDQINLSEGNFVFLIKNEHDKPVTITITLPTAVKDGEVFQEQRTLAAWDGEGDPVSLTNFLAPIDLGDYIVRPEEDSIYVEYLGIDSNGDTIAPPEGTLIGITEIRFDYAEGYLGQQLYEGSRDTIDIDFFDNWIRGDVYFEEPIITINIDNSFGVPTRSVINVFDIITVEGEILPLESDLITNGVDFPYPTLDEIGEVKTNSYVFNKDNSNIDEVLGAGPVAIDYFVNAITNPEEDTEIRGYITDSSFYNVQVDVDLPLYGNASNFIAQDTFELSLSQYDDVNSAEFKVVTENGLPLNVDIQGFFLGANDEVLDELMLEDDRLIAGAPVDAEGLPIEANRVVTYSDYPPDRFNRIRPTEKLVLVATFSTTDDGSGAGTNGIQSVQVLGDQKVKFKLGAILNVSN